MNSLWIWSKCFRFTTDSQIYGHFYIQYLMYLLQSLLLLVMKSYLFSIKLRSIWYLYIFKLFLLGVNVYIAFIIKICILIPNARVRPSWVYYINITWQKKHIFCLCLLNIFNKMMSVIKLMFQYHRIQWLLLLQLTLFITVTQLSSGKYRLYCEEG